MFDSVHDPDFLPNPVLATNDPDAKEKAKQKAAEELEKVKLRYEKIGLF